MLVNGYTIKAKADLSEADLSEANLRWANLSEANLRWANLHRADLHRADLSRADLSRADLSGADLRWANLSEADLSGANLREAILSEANLIGAKNIPKLGWTILVPEGNLIVYKKTHQGIVKLLIPKEAKRSNATSRKCRAEFALVLETPNHQPAFSLHESSFIYEEGKSVKADKWEKNRWVECGGGIHFFLTREEAENY